MLLPVIFPEHVAFYAWVERPGNCDYRKFETKEEAKSFAMAGRAQGYKASWGEIIR